MKEKEMKNRFNFKLKNLFAQLNLWAMNWQKVQSKEQQKIEKNLKFVVLTGLV